MTTTAIPAPASDSYDAVVVGGGAAGLSGAVVLARSRRSVLVVDSGSPRNAPADGVHAFLGHDGVPPAELLARGRAELARDGGHLVTGEVSAAGTTETGFVVEVEGRRVHARRLLVATGAVDELPDVPGLRERWGRDVVHCPYCHGWEVRDQPIGVLATQPSFMHQALLFRQLSDDVVVLAHGVEPTAEQREQLRALAIGLVTDGVAALETSDDRITGVRLRTGAVVPRSVLTVQTVLSPRLGALADLGLEVVDHPSGAVRHVPTTDAGGRSHVPGVWLAGNVTDPMAQVVAAAAAGTMAGAQINADLVMADAAAALTELRAAS